MPRRPIVTQGPIRDRGLLVEAISVEGYKSIAKKQRMEVRPLTILAGANSSGKSSVMQPALLMKQTLESTYDPGPLLLNGPNVSLSEFSQIFWRGGSTRSPRKIRIGFEIENETRSLSEFQTDDEGLELKRQVVHYQGTSYTLEPGISESGLIKLGRLVHSSGALLVERARCFFHVALATSPSVAVDVVPAVPEFLKGLIHLPATRSPRRELRKAAIGDAFPGTFGDYYGSVLNQWQRKQQDEVTFVGRDLETLGLTRKVKVEEIGDTSLSVFVGRLPTSSPFTKNDIVNLADVGIGVSQVLPAIVALWAAKPGNTVYIEEPELHLHPNAQARLGSILANAASRGVRVIIETHSSLLLRGIQTLVAEGKLKHEFVKLHWFQRDKRGATSISSADLDANGAFGDWPEDFDQVELDSDTQYLQAAGLRSKRK